MSEQRTELARLESEYGRFAADRERFEVPPMEFKRLAARAERGALGGARAVPRRGDAVLLVRTIDDKGGWSVPGGEREPDERYEETAARSVTEETGLAVSVDSLLSVKRFEFVNAFEPDEDVVGHWVWFGATDDGGSPAPQHPGVLSAGWFTELPDDVDPAAADRIEEWRTTSPSAAD